MSRWHRNLNESPDLKCDEMREADSVPRGFLRILLLRLLESQEMSGSQIAEVLEQRSKGEWRPSPGSLYPLLSSLEEEGLIREVRTEGRSKIYGLSEGGIELHKAMFKNKERVEDKTRLHRLLWLQLLDPVDRAHFHMSGIKMALHQLLEISDELTPSQKRKLAVRAQKAQHAIDTLLTKLDDGVELHD
jgi:DNA-binding PadR family transcriptional regulator